MAGNRAQQVQFGLNDVSIEEDIPTLSSVVLTGDETVIHSARLKQNLSFIEDALASRHLHLEDLVNSATPPDFICESNLNVIIDKVIESHTARMKAEILSILEAHVLSDPASARSRND